MIKAKKQFGQNFLKDKAILNQIIQAIPNDGKFIIEIGPGLGDLTEELVKNFTVISYEIDRDLYQILSKKFSKELKNGSLKLIMGDVLEIFSSEENYFLVSNLPYYIATKIILNALRDDKCLGFVVMVQKEVGLKFSANSGDKEFSSLAVLAWLEGECEYLFDVPPTAFEPPPKVTSGVIRLKKDKKFPLLDREKFSSFLKICFASPRKTIFRNLTANYSKELISEVFCDLNLDLNLRPHQIHNALFVKIYENLKARNGKQ